MQGSFLANDLRKVISIVDLLRDIGLGSQLSLPKVVVLGNQSSGKSSLLEQIVGLDFLPRGSGVVTRRPLQLRMNTVLDLAAPYAQFDEVVQKGVKKRFTNFNEVRTTIDLVTDQVCGKSKQIVDKPIVLNIFSKSCPTLTIVDLPGITSIPVGEQPVNIYQITKNMALRYISEKRSIILCVIPANQDLAVSQALKIMREIDPSGERSIGCLTKIDIMNRGDDARNMLKNLQIPLRYGYVGIKNRCQEDVINNVPVTESLKAEKKFFTTSPIYSSLPADLFGTDSLTKRLTNILYTQIKSSMPEIFEEIKKKKKIAQEQLEKLGPGVANTDAQMVNYAWKSVASFLRIYKNSLGGIKSSQYNKDPVSSTIREELTNIYKQQYDQAATEDITDKDIEKAMINFPGDSTIPGFPSIDAFLSLLNPLLKRLQNPAYQANNKVHQIMEGEALNIIGEILSAKYPQFNSRFKDLIKKILDKYRRSLESYLNSLLDCQLFYLFTNDINYLVGDFHKVANQNQKEKAPKNPLVYELRKRIDAYYKLVVRNLRDLIPKQIFNFLLCKCMKELEFEAFQFTSDVNKLKQWLNEPSQVRIKRTECIKAIKKRIRMDPDISKLVKRTQKESKYYGKFGMKSPDQLREEEEKRQSEYFQLVSKSKIEQKPKAPEKLQKKSESVKQPQAPNPHHPHQKAPTVVPNTNPVTPTNNAPKKDTNTNQVNGNQNTPKQNIPQTQPVNEPGKMLDFGNFFGTGNAPQPPANPQPKKPTQMPVISPIVTTPPTNPQPKKPTQMPVISPIVTTPPPVQKDKQQLPKNDFANFFGTNKAPTQGNNPSPTNNVNPVKPPEPPKPPVAPTPPTPPPQQKKKTFNKLFGLG